MVKLLSQQLPTFLSFHALYTFVSFEFTKSYGLYPSYNALQVLTLLAVVASVCPGVGLLYERRGDACRLAYG